MSQAITADQREKAAAIFRALSDPGWLQILLILADGERSVGQLAELEGGKTGTVSARLQLLLNARLVKRRREAQSVIYAIADDHVLNLIRNAIDHASEH